jgi:hypothetical protein
MLPDRLYEYIPHATYCLLPDRKVLDRDGRYDESSRQLLSALAAAPDFIDSPINAFSRVRSFRVCF